METLLTPYHRYLAGKYYRYNQLLFLGGTTDLLPAPASGEWSFFKKKPNLDLDHQLSLEWRWRIARESLI